MIDLKKMSYKIMLIGFIFCLTSNNCNAIAKETAELKVLKHTQASIKPAITHQSKMKDLTKTEATYKLIPSSKTKEAYAVVSIKNKEIARFDSVKSNYSPEVRAKILVSKLNKFIASKNNAKAIVPGFENGEAVVRADKELLLTVHPDSAKKENIFPSALALKYANNIRESLNTPKIVRNNQLITSRGNLAIAFTRSHRLFDKQNGLASWYGGVFHGRRAADGSVFSKHELTAAHKTLPFGTLVKVTNKRNEKSCIVKITDRGPFVRGRIIDLSRAAAKQIDILSSGISYVNIEVVN